MHQRRRNLFAVPFYWLDCPVNSCFHGKRLLCERPDKPPPYHVAVLGVTDFFLAGWCYLTYLHQQYLSHIEAPLSGLMGRSVYFVFIWFSWVDSLNYSAWLCVVPERSVNTLLWSISLHRASIVAPNSRRQTMCRNGIYEACICKCGNFTGQFSLREISKNSVLIQEHSHLRLHPSWVKRIHVYSLRPSGIFGSHATFA